MTPTAHTQRLKPAPRKPASYSADVLYKSWAVSVTIILLFHTYVDPDPPPQQQQQQNRQQQLLDVNVGSTDITSAPIIRILPLDTEAFNFTEIYQQRFWARQFDDAGISQFATAFYLEQEVLRRHGPWQIDNPPEIAVVPFHPHFHGMYGEMVDEKNFQKELEQAAPIILGKIKSLPLTTQLLFTVTHPDEYIHLNQHVFQPLIKEGRLYRPLLIRLDLGNTVCGCYYRPFWGPKGVEVSNIMVPYAVTFPQKFISLEARTESTSTTNKQQQQRNTLLYFNGNMNGDMRPQQLQAFQNLSQTRSDIVYTSERIDHDSYLQKIMGSKYCLVPEGHTATSLRLFETLVAECVPVIVSDCIDLPFEGLPPIGDYSSFALIVTPGLKPRQLVKYLEETVKSGHYAKLKAKLNTIWPYFTVHDGQISQILKQPSAVQLILDNLHRYRTEYAFTSYESERRKRYMHCFNVLDDDYA